MKKTFAAMAFAAALLSHGAAADEVRLRHGGVEIAGALLGFDGTYLRVQTDHGEVTLDYRLAECEGAACPRPENFVPFLRFSGAARMADLLLPALIEGYARDKGLRALRREIDASHFEYDIVARDSGLPQLRMAFHVTTSQQGFADLLSNQTDLVLSLREITEAERAAAEEAGLGALKDPRHSEIIALDAIVPVISPRRDLESITLSALARLIRREIADWAEIGAEPGPISIHLLGETGGLAQLFLSAAPGAEEPRGHSEEGGFAIAVALDKDAIGIAPFEAYGLTHPLRVSGPCGIEVAATRMSLKTEDYPLTRPLFLYRPARRFAPESERWLDWLRSEAAQQVIKRAGFVDREIEGIPLAAQGDRLARAIALAGGEVSLADVQQMVARLSQRERLSLSFRFYSGSTRLSAQSRSNLLRLATALREGVFDGRRLILTGFSDGKGPADANRALSLARAENVRQELERSMGGALPEAVSLEIDAFGEMLPVACDDSAWGQESNRRVELWIAR